MPVGEMPSHKHDYRLFCTSVGTTQTDCKQGKFMAAQQSSNSATAWTCGDGKSVEVHLDATGSNAKHAQVPTYFSAYFYRRIS